MLPTHACMLSHFSDSDSLQPHGLEPARLLQSWNSPSKNTGVGCHSLLQGIILTQGLNPCLLSLLPWQACSLPVAPLGKTLLIQFQFSHSVVSDSVTSWTAACQASLSVTNSWSFIELMSIELVIPSNHLILCHPLLFLPSILPSIRVFCIRWPKYWSFSFSISPSNE